MVIFGVLKLLKKKQQHYRHSISRHWNLKKRLRHVLVATSASFCIIQQTPYQRPPIFQELHQFLPPSLARFFSILITIKFQQGAPKVPHTSKRIMQICTRSYRQGFVLMRFAEDTRLINVDGFLICLYRLYMNWYKLFKFSENFAKMKEISKYLLLTNYWFFCASVIQFFQIFSLKKYDFFPSFWNLCRYRGTNIRLQESLANILVIAVLSKKASELMPQNHT